MAFKSTFTLLAVLLACANAKAPLLSSDSPNIIQDEYIVVMKEEIGDQEVEAHKSAVRSAIQLSGNFSKIKFEYNIGKDFRGYSIKADPKLLDTIRSMNHVDYVEHNQKVRAIEGEVERCCVYQDSAVWGLHRTVSRGTKPEEDFYAYSKESAGTGVDVYVIDTGIYLQHSEFEGRAKWGFDAVQNPSPRNDLNGHGTHVAGTVIGRTLGLARKATAIAVRVLDAEGYGTFDGTIAGIEYTARQHGPGKKSIANMSLGMRKSRTINNAVNAAIRKGVHFVIAAGNEDQNACDVSPASSKGITVAATDNEDYRSYFSNWGNCVQLFAPGSAIESAYPNFSTATATLSGTSMAAPHVAGVAAKLLSEKDMTPDEMLVALEDRATKGIIRDRKGSPNLLLYHSCFDD